MNIHVIHCVTALVCVPVEVRVLVTSVIEAGLSQPCAMLLQDKFLEKGELNIKYYVFREGSCYVAQAGPET